MNKNSLWIRTIIIVVITLIGAYLVFGPRGSVSANDFSWQGIKNNLSNNINLGLDLEGGSQLMMRVKTEDYLRTLTENNREAALRAAQDAQLPVSGAVSTAENNNYSVTLQVGDAARIPEIIAAVKAKVDFANANVVWTETTTDNSIVWSLPVQAQQKLRESATEQAQSIIESRIDSFGVKEPTFQRVGRSDSGQLLLQMPGVEDPERVKKLIDSESRLELAKVVDPFQVYPTEAAALQSVGGTLPQNRKILPYMDRDEASPTAAANQQNPNEPSGFVVLESPAIVDGSELRDASAYSQTGSDNDYEIAFSLKPGGAEKMGEFTRKNIGKSMAIVLNDQVKSAPTIQGQISDSGQITGRFTKASAGDLALTLKSGALPAKIEYQEERTVGPSLGADSIRSGVAASIGGLVLIVLFMLFYYRGSGVNAVIALLLNMLLTVAALVMFGSTLTLPGIAGLILGIGMAVDSNVLIFERVREELRRGVDVSKSIDLGFDRAFVTIIDTHITTIISSVILYLYGSGPIKGFAVTLILGLLINLFSAVFVSRTIFMWLLSRRQRMEKLSI
ncbi:MAG TPA: protein translocase subunit SecD [Pyrinomonadaceae bacterium]|nr:protein translocase subunit SecD [Pyrinomonadaceae bacterium]